MTDRAAQFRAFADTDGRTAPLYAQLANGAADDPEILALLDPGASPPAAHGAAAGLGAPPGARRAGGRAGPVVPERRP